MIIILMLVQINSRVHYPFIKKIHTHKQQHYKAREQNNNIIIHLYILFEGVFLVKC